MDVDKLFKLPKLPSSSVNKRKWAEPDGEAIKAARTGENGTASSASVVNLGDESGPRRPPAPHVDDEGDEEQDGDDGDFAPGNDADYFIEEDDEGGRFFGGGLTDQQKRILEIMNRGDTVKNGEDKKPDQDLAAIRKQLLKFERAINKNQEMRVKYANDPRKFIESEADLDAEIKGLVILTTNPGLYYPELPKNGTPASLCGLLSHENADIAGAVIETIEELTDDDVLDSGQGDGIEDDEDDSNKRKGEEGMSALVDSLLENSVLELLVQNLARFNDDGTVGTNQDADSDAQNIYHLLGVLENLVSFRPALSEKLLKQTDILSWLLARISRKGTFDQNKGYAAELLAIFLQGNRVNGSLVGQKGGIDTLLSALSAFRKRDPHDADEAEFMENLFDALCSVLQSNANKRRFREAEGVELMVIMMREKRLIRLRAIKVLNHALSASAGSQACEIFVTALGLKSLFSAFMGKGKKHLKSSDVSLADDEHILGVFSSLLSSLGSDTAPRLRVLSKFVEGDYEKIDRLLELRETALGRVKLAEKEIDEEKNEILDEGEILTPEEEEIFHLKRLESGLFMLQLVDYILAWLAMEDDGARAHTKMLLQRKGASFDDIIEVLKEYYSNIGDDEVKEEEEGAAGEEEGAIGQKEIIVELVNFLLQCD